MTTMKNQSETLEHKTDAKNFGKVGLATKEKNPEKSGETSKNYKKKEKKLSPAKSGINSAKSLPTSRDSSGKKDIEDPYFYHRHRFGLHRWSWL